MLRDDVGGKGKTTKELRVVIMCDQNRQRPGTVGGKLG